MITVDLRNLFASLCLALLVSRTGAQTWCGKNYKKTLPPTPPGGKFLVPASSASPLLAFRCAPVLRPYLPEDASQPGTVGILIDTPIIYSQISGASPVNLSGTSSSGLAVSVTVGGQLLAEGLVPLNATGSILPFSLGSLQARKAAYNLTCSGTLGTQKYQATEKLTYLPTPPSTIGSVTKTDLRTGALLARPADGKGGSYAPVLPIGYYTSFDYLSADLTIPAKLKAQGFNVVHPIPPFTNLTALDAVLTAMQQAGLYLMYDMRWTYMNSTAVTEEVNRIKSRPNLLLWYTADEPDGTSDPLDATVKASNLITSLDGGDGTGGAAYHPVSLVLNCQDYQFSPYTAGADIIMQDVYMVGNNVTYSTVWGTICNEDYGDCGCDNCIGTFEDISTRMDQFRERLFLSGWGRTKAVWTVPQGFGNETYWHRYPTGQEFVVESIMGVNHGALGVISWDDPTSADIKSSSSALAIGLQTMAPFILSADATSRQVTVNGVDHGLWTLGDHALVLATNPNYVSATVTLADLGLSNGVGRVTQVFNSGSSVNADGKGLSFNSVGSGGFIVKL